MPTDTLIQIEIMQHNMKKKMDKIMKWQKLFKPFVNENLKPKSKPLLISLAIFAIILTVLKIYSYIQLLNIIFSVVALIGGLYFFAIIFIVKEHESFVKHLHNLEEQKQIALKYEKEGR